MDIIRDARKGSENQADGFSVEENSAALGTEWFLSSLF